MRMSVACCLFLCGCLFFSSCTGIPALSMLEEAKSDEPFLATAPSLAPTTSGDSHKPLATPSNETEKFDFEHSIFCENFEVTYAKMSEIFTTERRENDGHTINLEDGIIDFITTYSESLYPTENKTHSLAEFYDKSISERIENMYFNQIMSYIYYFDAKLVDVNIAILGVLVENGIYVVDYYQVANFVDGSGICIEHRAYIIKDKENQFKLIRLWIQDEFAPHLQAQMVSVIKPIDIAMEMDSDDDVFLQWLRTRSQ